MGKEREDDLFAWGGKPVEPGRADEAEQLKNKLGKSFLLAPNIRTRSIWDQNKYVNPLDYAKNAFSYPYANREIKTRTAKKRLSAANLVRNIYLHKNEYSI